MSTPLEPHFNRVIQAMIDGRVVPLLGAGVNPCGRPHETPWQRGRCYMGSYAYY